MYVDTRWCNPVTSLSAFRGHMYGRGTFARTRGGDSDVVSQERTYDLLSRILELRQPFILVNHADMAAGFEREVADVGLEEVSDDPVYLSHEL